MPHKAKATNWNGKPLDLIFSAKSEDLAKLAEKARKLFESKGFTTIRLDSIDSTALPYELQY